MAEKLPLGACAGPRQRDDQQTWHSRVKASPSASTGVPVGQATVWRTSCIKYRGCLLCLTPGPQCPYAQATDRVSERKAPTRALHAQGSMHQWQARVGMERAQPTAGARLRIGPQAQRPIRRRGQEEARPEGRPGDRIHRAQVAGEGSAVLLRVARAAEVDGALLRAWPGEGAKMG